MKPRSLICLLAVLGLAFVATTTAEDKEDLAGIKCPVSGKDINPDATVDYRGGKVYMCCPGCPKAFAKNNEKFAAKANHQLVATGQFVQKACPLTGKPAKDDKVVDASGVKVGLCCPGCEGKVKKSDDVVALLFVDKAFEKGFEKAGDE